MWALNPTFFIVGGPLSALPISDYVSQEHAESWRATSNLSPGIGPPFTDRRGSGAGGLRWIDLDVSSRISRRLSTAVEAGRSKAKKGQSSGGRIEGRPQNFRRPRPGENPNANEGEQQQQQQQQGREVGEGNIQRNKDSTAGFTEEEELNLTWQDAGLGDKRSGGRFRPERMAAPREAQRVGGWGRDKSMQRVITPEQQREGRGGGRRDNRDRAGNRPKLQNPEPSEEPLGQKKKHKLYEGFDPDPTVRHPPDYYKYGPFGPWASKGITVGKVVEGNFATNQVVFFSNVKDEAEGEDREKANVTVDYTERVSNFDPSVRSQFLYAFARRRFGPRPDPWEDWTLVAQIAVESEDEFGEQGELFRKMGSRTQDVVTQCVAWARPDLTYVRKPNFHLRLESQEKFLKELFVLLDPSGEERNDSNTYYATLCTLVRVNQQASARDVRSGYEALDEEGKMECLKHVFTRHPVKILSSARYERRVLLRQQQGEQDGQNRLMGFEPSEGETDDEDSTAPVDEDDDNESDQAGESLGSNRGIRGLGEFLGSSGGQRQPADYASDDESDEAGESSGPNREITGLRGEFMGGSRGQFQPAEDALVKKKQRDGRRSRGPKKRVFTQPFFRSAARPFSYSNMIEEIAHIRIYLCRKHSMVSIS